MEEKEKKRSLEHFPVQLFAVVMGLSGLVIAYGKAYHFFNFPRIIYLSLLAVDTFLFFAIFTTYMLKWLKYPEAVKKEYEHPIKSSFIATISICFLLISIAYYDFAPTISVVYWFIGAPLHLFFTLSVISFWIRGEFHVKHINPAWFIPIVGNVLVPVMGVDMMPVYVSYFYFTLGMFFWLVLFTIITYRMIFHEPMPQRLIPTFFILIAPPAVGFISYLRMTFGSNDLVSQFLYLIAFFFLMQLAFMVKMFTKLKFFISWWAYTFPLDAITIATILQYMMFRTAFLKWLSIVLLIVTTVVIGIVAYKTVQAALEEKICVAEE